VINEPKGKKDIENKRFFYRTFASKDANIRKWYSDTLGMRLRQRGSFKYTVLEKVHAGYIRKRGEEYVITPAVKIGNKNVDDESRMKSYMPIHEWELRNLNVQGYIIYTMTISKKKITKVIRL